MNAPNRATFTAGPSREIYNECPRQYTERAKTNERQWREQMERLRREVIQDTAALSQY